MLKIATWNINSLRVRLPHVLQWLKEHQPDILALQETKVLDADFPFNEIKEAGYESHICGQRTYNGVALLTRKIGHDLVRDIPLLDDPQRRMIAITHEDIRILNLYVPNGESLLSEKYAYKLNWLKHLQSYVQAELLKYPKLIILGDFNIAPEDVDVHNPSAWAGKILCSPAEREVFRNLVQLGLNDCFRLHEQPEKSFSWWDYRMNSFKRNMGLRIDHILATQAMAGVCHRCYIDKNPRQAERPSDHTPVIAEFEI